MTTDIIQRLKQAGRVSDADAAAWAEIGSLLQAIEAIVKDGATAVVKLDGERSTDRYTVIVSGGPLGAEFHRGDGDDLRKLLQEAIHFYDQKVWSSPKR